MTSNQHEYPVFDRAEDRDAYLNRLIARGYRVKAKTEYLFSNELFTVEEIDKRSGK